MKILLINPPQNLTAILGVGKAFVQKYEPLGLLYVAAVAQENAYSVSVLDAFAEELTPEEVQNKIIRERPDIIGISTLTCNGSIVFELGKWIRINFPQTWVVLGNIHASVFAEQFLKEKCCDIVVHGEGEYTFLNILKTYSNKDLLPSIKGISFANDNEDIITTEAAPTIDDLDNLPFPARDLVDSSLYGLTEISNQAFIGGTNIATKTLFTSRGCPQHCEFCIVHKNEKQRFSDFNKVVDEMQMLMERYGARYLTIMDPLFIGNKQRVFDICTEIKKRNLQIQWGCDAHVNYITPELVKEMESAGCCELDFGIESGVQRILDSMNKGTTIDKIIRALAITKAHSKIKIGGLFILGFPTETYTDAIETIRFAKSLPLDIAQFSIFTPYPGSPIFYELSRNHSLCTGINADGSVDTSVWERYSAYISFTDKEPIWVTDTLSHSKIVKLQKKAQRDFYMRPSQIIKHIRRVKLHNISTLIEIIWKGFF